MLRTAFALFLLVNGVGCVTFGSAGRQQNSGVRYATVGACDNGSNCDRCIPPRPWTCHYHAWWDNCITAHTARRCAGRDLREYHRETGYVPSNHFKHGFAQAYEDLAMNRRPSPPIIPPPKYWNAFYRSSAGQGYVDDWFDGYDAGLDWGRQSGVCGFNEIYLNRVGTPDGSANNTSNRQTVRGAAKGPVESQSTNGPMTGTY